MSLKIGDKNVSSIKISDKNVVKILDHLGNSIWQEEPGINVPLTFTCVSNIGSITLNKKGEPHNNTFKYIKNNVEYEYNIGEKITLTKNESISFIGTTDKLGKSYGNHYYFTMTGTIKSSGNINSLLNYGNLSNYCYLYLFEYCNSLISAPEILPSMSLANGCYEGMFLCCSKLINAPSLPATVLNYTCYRQMFHLCNSLINIPSKLPATALATMCYCGMFSRCASLTKVPKLPATTLAKECYEYMFDGCTSLKEAPELPATTLAESCYANMFDECTSLKEAPELPATTLASNCYKEMFKYCTSLSYIKVGFTDWNKSQGTSDVNYNSTSGWIQNAKNNSSCTFECPTSLTEDRNNISAIPSNWTITKF